MNLSSDAEVLQFGIVSDSDTTSSMNLSGSGVVNSVSSHLLVNLEVRKIKKEPQSRLIAVIRGLFGMAVLILIAWLFSSDRKSISWKIVGIDLTIQTALALCILHVSVVRILFEVVGKGFTKVLDFTQTGSQFLFGNLMDIGSFVFALQILPTIIFFLRLLAYYSILELFKKLFMLWLG